MVIGGNKNNYFVEDIWDAIRSSLWLLVAIKIIVLLRNEDIWDTNKSSIWLLAAIKISVLLRNEDIWDTNKSSLWLLAAIKISVLLRIFGIPLRVCYGYWRQ